MAHVTITDQTIHLDDVSRQVFSPHCGAVVTFSGTTRAESRGRRVEALVYEAYLPLAEKQLQKIAEEAEARWGVVCAIAHRLGRVEIGERSVAIAVASPHRAEGFDACRWLMDELKSSVPIWKKEISEDGAHWIEGSAAIPSPASPKQEASRPL